jgi:hypothetical protein
LVSLEARIQFITGVTDLSLPMNGSPEYKMACGGDYICSGPKMALAGFLKGSLFMKPADRTIRPVLSLGAGFGAIRHTAPVNFGARCGSSRDEACVDSFGDGPLQIATGAGLHIRLWRALDLVVETQLAVAAPRFSFNLDANLGLACLF